MVTDLLALMSLPLDGLRLALIVGASLFGGGGDEPQVAGQEDDAPPSPSRWYLERGTAQREARPEDDVPEVAARLAVLMRDRRVPGFYDGQFASTANDFDALARLARDESTHHILRMMSIMALQEAADGERLAHVLEPLVMDPDVEFAAERQDWGDFGRTTDERFVRRTLAADLSRHARFALAKDGQPAKVLEKIAVLERHVFRHRVDILNPTIKSKDDPNIAWLRTVWFDIAYHYQQFDDYERASIWFRDLTDALDGDDTRWAHYNLACIAAIEGRLDDAMTELHGAAAAGFLDVEWIQEDGDLTPLRDRADFAALVTSMGGTPKSNAGSVLPGVPDDP